MSSDLVTINESILATLPEALQLKILAASEKIQASSVVSINKIRLDAKSYIFPDQTETQSFSGVIVGTKHANIHYEKEYVDGVNNTPDCVAYGDASCKDLTPMDEVEAKYSTVCGTCKKFQWGSAAKGKGKACSEHTLLAVHIPAFGEELYLLEEKKGNSKTVDGYLAGVTAKHGHPVAVLTKFTIGEKAKWEQTFSFVDRINAELVTNLVDRFDEADAMLSARVRESYQRGQTDSTEEEVTTTPTANSRPDRSR